MAAARGDAAGSITTRTRVKKAVEEESAVFVLCEIQYVIVVRDSFLLESHEFFFLFHSFARLLLIPSKGMLTNKELFDSFFF